MACPFHWENNYCIQHMTQLHVDIFHCNAKQYDILFHAINNLCHPCNVFVLLNDFVRHDNVLSIYKSTISL